MVEGRDLNALLSDIGIEYGRMGMRSLSLFESVLPISDLQEGCLTFISKGSRSFIDLLSKNSGAVVLVERGWADENTSELDALDHALFAVDSPRLVLARLLDELKMEKHLEYSGVHPTAIVDKAACIHPSAVVGPFCIVGRCTISEGVVIGPYTMIENSVSLGRGVKIREHCTIGGYGFGFARTDSGSLVRVPHIGAVVIEEDVEIFPFVNVDCATLTETRVRKGAKLDHYVHVGHNSEVGEDAIVTAGVVLCGGSSVGSQTWIGVGATIKEGVRVNSGATVGLGAVVLKDVGADDVVAGVPATSLLKGGTKNEAV